MSVKEYQAQQVTIGQLLVACIMMLLAVGSMVWAGGVKMSNMETRIGALERFEYTSQERDQKLDGLRQDVATMKNDLLWIKQALRKGN